VEEDGGHFELVKEHSVVEPHICKKCLTVFANELNACPYCDHRVPTDPLTKLKELCDHQCTDGTWNYDPYLHGMTNGLILAVATLEGSELVFLEAPEMWIRDQEEIDAQLTDMEITHQCDVHGLVAPNTECVHSSPAGCRHCGVCKHQIEE
jgi:hypothetical protein